MTTGVMLYPGFLRANRLLYTANRLDQLLKGGHHEKAYNLLQKEQSQISRNNLGFFAALLGIYNHHKKNNTEDLVPRLESQFNANPSNLQTARALLGAYMQLKNTNKLREFAAKLADNDTTNIKRMLLAATAYNYIKDWKSKEPLNSRLTKMTPERPDVWYDLGTVQNHLGKTNEALASFQKALALPPVTHGTTNRPLNIRHLMQSNPALNNLREWPEFKAIIQKP